MPGVCGYPDGRHVARHIASYNVLLEPFFFLYNFLYMTTSCQLTCWIERDDEFEEEKIGTLAHNWCSFVLLAGLKLLSIFVLHIMDINE